MKTWGWLVPTGTWVRLAIVPVLVFVSMSVDRQYLRDFWHHLARGEFIVTQGVLLNEDIYTYTVHGEPLTDVNWLSQVMYYHLFEAGGLELVQVANALVLALTFFLVVLFCWQKSQSLGIATAVGIFTFFGSWQVLTIRPQTFSLLLFVLIYWCLDGWRKRPWLLLIPPVLVGLWANLHGAFPAGWMLVGCFAAAQVGKIVAEEMFARPQTAMGQRLRSSVVALAKDRAVWLLTACFVGSVLATLVNPYGWTIYEYVGVTSNRAKARGIAEWLAPSMDLLIGWFWLMSMVLTAALLLAGWFKCKRRPTAIEVVLALLFLTMACLSVRMVVWWLIIAAPIFASWLAAVWPKPEAAPAVEKPNTGSALTFAMMVVLAIINIPGLESINPLALATGRTSHRLEYELELAQRHIDENAEAGRIFTRFEWGEYWAWRAGPKFQVFMDARIEIIPDDVWQQYIDLTTGKDNWQQILDQYEVDYLVLDVEYHGENGLLARVQQSPQWHKTYQVGDDIFVYTRQEKLTELSLARAANP
jgi:hypothetical protein